MSLVSFAATLFIHLVTIFAVNMMCSIYSIIQVHAELRIWHVGISNQKLTVH